MTTHTKTPFPRPGSQSNPIQPNPKLSLSFSSNPNNIKTNKYKPKERRKKRVHIQGSLSTTSLVPANPHSILPSSFNTLRSTKYAPTVYTNVSVGSDASSGSQRILTRVEISVAIILLVCSSVLVVLRFGDVGDVGGNAGVG